jgi:pimeloyl-ACP methyl ester carboxylesterase
MRASQQEMPMQRREFVTLTSGSLIAPMLLSAASAATGARVSAAEFGAMRRFTDTRFGRIAHIDRGRGDAVLFLHGLPLNGFQWRDSIAALSSDRRCLAPDFLGLGYTEVVAGQSVGPLDQMAMLLAFLDAKGVRKVDVIASDSGGAVAQHLVTRHPERVRSLLLANCDCEIDYPLAALQVPFELSKQGKFADDVVRAWQADKALVRSDEKGLGACYADASRLPDEAFDEYLLPLLASPQKKAKLHEYILALEANPLAGIESALGKCRVPTRIVWGAEDRVFSTKSPEYLAQTFGNSKGLRLLEGSKLFWPEERPEVVIEEARKLWEA